VTEPADERTTVQIRMDGQERNATLTLTRTPWEDPSLWQLRLVCGDRHWQGSGHDVFTALLDLMSHLDPDQVLIGVNGARPDAWPSGMAAQMSGGLIVYLLPPKWTRDRPPTARTLDPAPLAVVGTLTDKDTYRRAWQATIGHQ